MEDKRKTALAGSFISRPLADLLALRSLYEGSSKSKILRDLIVEYLMSGPSIDDMCEKLAEKIFKSWLYLEEYKKYPWDEYLKSEKENLEKNNVSEKHTSIIIEKAKQKREKIKHGTNK